MAIQDDLKKQLASQSSDGTAKIYHTISSTVTNGPTLLTARLPSAAATTNATVVKASAGRMTKVVAYNASAAVKFLKLYNKATAPTVGTDVPVLTFTLKPADSFNADFEDFGFQFATGISYALTGLAADADTTVLTAGDVVGLNIIYI